MIRATRVFCAVALALFVSAMAAQAPQAADPLSSAEIKSTLSYLAYDAMAGRDTPSVELDRAADWIAQRLTTAGIQPGGVDGTFFHRWTMKTTVIESKDIAVSIHSADGAKTLAPGQDVRLWRGSRAFAAENTECMRIDLSKPAEAALLRRQGATKPIFVEVSDDSPLWLASATKRYITGRSGRGSPIFLVRKGLILSTDPKATISVPEAQEEEVGIRNVIGILPGGAKKDEFVLFGAHYDHIGTNLASAEDVVFNGADDDGTGTTSVLQLACAYARAKERPARSLAFAFWAGEEKGLLGSAKFALAPTIPLDRIVANLNGRPPFRRSRRSTKLQRTRQEAPEAGRRISAGNTTRQVTS